MSLVSAGREGDRDVTRWADLDLDLDLILKVVARFARLTKMLIMSKPLGAYNPG